MRDFPLLPVEAERRLKAILREAEAARAMQQGLGGRRADAAMSLQQLQLAHSRATSTNSHLVRKYLTAKQLEAESEAEDRCRKALDALGALRVVGADAEKIAEAAQHLADVRFARDEMKEAHIKADPPEMASLNAEIAEAEAERDRAQEDCDAANAKHEPLFRLAQRLEQYATNLSDKVALFRGAVKTRSSDSPAAGVARCRKELKAILAEEAKVRRAQRPREINIADMRRQVETLAARGRPDVFKLIEQGGSIAWPKLPLSMTGTTNGLDGMRGNAFVMGDVFDGGGLFAWTFRDALIEALQREIDLRSDPENAMSEEDRDAKLIVLKTKRLAIEREEESLIGGAPGIMRRQDVDPRAILNLDDDAPDPKEN